MIDDITIAARLDGIGDEVPVSMMLLDPVRGRPDVWGVSCAEGQLFVTYCPTTKMVTVRISVPRWLHGGRVNYPLVPIRSVDDLHPHRLSVEVAHALGLPVSSIGTDADDLIPIRSWALIRSSHAVDLTVADPVNSVLGCLGIPRKHKGKFACFGDPLSTAQWSSKTLRSKFYAKGLEIASHRSKTEEERDDLDRLAKEAQGILRFEVSFLQVRALRDFLGISDGRLPTLAFMCDPRIDAWVLTREAVRLRFDRDYSGDKRVLFPARVRHVGATLLQAQADLASGVRVLGRRKALTPERLWDLAATYFLASGYKLSEMEMLSGRSRSALAEMIAELRELGISPDASPLGTMGAAVDEIQTALEPYLLDELPPRITGWPDVKAFTDAPWGEDEGADYGDDDGDHGDDDAAGFAVEDVSM